MSLYADLKIRDKLIAGYLVIVLFSCLIGYFGVKGMGTIKASLDDVQNQVFPSVTLIAEIEKHAQLHRRYFLRYLPGVINSQIADIEYNLDNEERQLRESLEKFGKLTIPVEARSLFAEARTANEVYLDATAKLRRKAEAGVNFASLQEENQQILLLFSKFEELTRQLAQLNALEVEDHFNLSNTSFQNLRFWLLLLTLCSALLAISMTLLITRSIVNPIRLVLSALSSLQEQGKEKSRVMEAIAGGDLNHDISIGEPLLLEPVQVSKDEAGKLLKAMVGMSEVQTSFDQSFARMTSALRFHREEESRRLWFKNGQNELHTILRGEKSRSKLTEEVLAFLARYLGAGVGVFYLPEDKTGGLEIAASYALPRRQGVPDRIAIGEGLVGQAAREGEMILHSAPAAYLPITSGLGGADPLNIVILPLLYNDAVVGVIELGSFRSFTPDDREFLQQTQEGLAIALSVNKSRQRVDELLEETQAQTEELRVQQEELQQTNEELEERAQILEEQREQIRAKNRQIEESSRELERKAEETEQISRYKSEFLANMSHELRTPLNSLMILSGLLKENRNGNLTDKQVEFAATINGAGRDLLNLINDILDLSKIEAGHLEFSYEELLLEDLCSGIEGTFQPIAADKKIRFAVTQDDSVPATIRTDRQRVEQILKNLLANACKFTHKGSVSLRLYTPDAKENPLAAPCVAFAVSDSGIGIPKEKQSLIFNAFQQGDGSTSRTYGGTGLGLSISHQLTRSMGGVITVISTPGIGSTFTLYLPQQGETPESQAPKTSIAPARPASGPTENPTEEPLPAPIPDDRVQAERGARSILIIEDDLPFAKILADLVRERGFSALIAADGENGIALSERYQPNAILLDVMLPHIDGWGVMRRLKDNPRTRHIPVHFITCLEERQKAMNMGAIGFVNKPVSSADLDKVFGTVETSIHKTMKMLLIVEDDPAQAEAMVALLEERNVSITVASSGTEAIRLLGSELFDCIVLDLGLADMGAFELLDELKRCNQERHIPVIIHTGRELTREDEKHLHHYAESIIIKGAKSPERLLNEVTLFLHLVESSLHPDKQQMIRTAIDKEAMLTGKKILIVDDDMRNIFSLTSALTEKGLCILEAENGHEALQRLNSAPDIDLVLMDIMMPEMDGYEAMRSIRKDPRFQALPIIALTAKAMKGDRQECLNAGASDYISKPVEMERLFSLLRVWLHEPATSYIRDEG